MSLAEALLDLQELTRRLRRECPWDREQTARTIVPHTVEEAYEVADAALVGRRGDASRRARRPALPGLLPVAAPRGARRRRSRAGRARRPREARAPPSARLRRRRGADRRPRSRALGADQDGAGGARGDLPRRSRGAARAALGAQGAAPGGDGRLRLARCSTDRSAKLARGDRRARATQSTQAGEPRSRDRARPARVRRGRRRPLHGRQRRPQAERRSGARAARDDAPLLGRVERGRAMAAADGRRLGGASTLDAQDAYYDRAKEATR